MSTTETEIQQALRAALPLACRASIDVSSMRLLADDGAELGPAQRDALLAACRDGKHVAVTVELAPAYEQTEAPNRNFVRFDEAGIGKLAASGKGTPWLKNHEQEDVMARGGTIAVSKLEKLAAGHYKINQSARLTAPWAVELAVRDLLGGASIGWRPTGPVLCSKCGTEIFTACYHLPGDRVSLETAPDGSKMYVRDAAGTEFVEWVFTRAELLETSAVNVPGVPSAGHSDVRGALSAVLPMLVAGDGLIAKSPPLTMRAAAEALSAVQGLAASEPEPKEPSMSDTAKTEHETQIERLKSELATSEAERERLAAEKAKEIAEREIVARIAEHEQRQADTRRLCAELGISDGRTTVLVKLAATLKNFDEVKAAILAAAIEERKEQSVDSKIPHTEVGTESHEKLFEVAKEGILARMAGKEPTTNEVGRFSRLSLTSIGEELLESRGVSTKQLRDLGRLEKAKVLMGAKSMRLSGGMVSGDLSSLVGAVFSARLRQKYRDNPAEWKRCALRVDLDDFTETPAYGLSNFPPLEDVPEGGEYKRGGLKQSSVNVQLEKGGRIISFTWEMMVNDRLGQLEQVINDRFQAVLRYERRKFLSKLSANKIAGTATDFFSSGNANINASTGIPSVTTLKGAMLKLALQTGEAGVGGEVDSAGEILGLVPAYWMLGAEDYITADQLLGDGFVPTSESGSPSSAMRRLKSGLVLEASLDSASPVYNLIFADPQVCAAVQYGHLTEQPGPFVEEQDGFEIDGKDYKVTDPFYVELVNPRGAVKTTRS